MTRIILACIAIFFCMSAMAGAWGEGSFENDDALDWVNRCVRSTGPTTVNAALAGALKGDFIEASEGSAAVAAAEVVAAAIGKPNPNFPPELKAWLEHQSKQTLSELAPRAKQALKRVKDAKASELKQLWSEGKANKWSSRIAELESRLGG